MSAARFIVLMNAGRLGGSTVQSDVATALGVDPSAVNHITSGRRSVPLATALKVAELAHVSLDWLYGRSEVELGRTSAQVMEARAAYLASGPSRDPDWHELPKVAFAAAGEPLHALPPDAAYYAFHRSWVQRKAKGAVDDDERLVVVEVDKKQGESMAPHIRPGAVLVIDRGPGGEGVSREALRASGVYLVNPEPEHDPPPLTIKRVNVVGDSLVLTSDNPNRERFPPQLVSLRGRAFQKVVVGRVIWIGQEPGDVT